MPTGSVCVYCIFCKYLNISVWMLIYLKFKRKRLRKDKMNTHFFPFVYLKYFEMMLFCIDTTQNIFYCAIKYLVRAINNVVLKIDIVWFIILVHLIIVLNNVLGNKN